MDAFGCSAFTPEGHVSLRGRTTDDRYGEWFLKCKYGVPGDRFWVRETWAPGDDLNPPETVWYRADNSLRGIDGQALDTYAMQEPRWKPSIHMPRWASRITLEVTDVRIERLQEITQGDVLGEGLELPHDGLNTTFDPIQKACLHPELMRDWKALWDGLNAKRGYGWDANPWVWVIGFKVLEVRK